MWMARLVVILVALRPAAEATWYGNEFLGRRHAASWHAETPAGFTDYVDSERFGVAAPISIPFGTRLRITRQGAVCGRSSPFDGTSIIVTVVDRMGDYTREDRYDLWPAAAKALGMGPTYHGLADDGRLRVTVERLDYVEEATLPLGLHHVYELAYGF